MQIRMRLRLTHEVMVLRKKIIRNKKTFTLRISTTSCSSAFTLMFARLSAMACYAMLHAYLVMELLVNNCFLPGEMAITTVVVGRGSHRHHHH